MATFSAELDGVTYTDQQAYATAYAAKVNKDLNTGANQQASQSAFDVLYQEFAQYGLQTLVAPLKTLMTEGASQAEMAVRLAETDAYKTRFAANDVRVKAGLRALSPGEYIATENTYRQVLRQYGLNQFDNNAYVQQFLEKDISPAEVSTRVSKAVERVKMADPYTLDALKSYGLSEQDAIAYVLDSKNSLPNIEKKIATAEIGGAALRQGLTAGENTAAQLQAMGITQAQAVQGYATIAEQAPTMEKLSAIYGSQVDKYGQTQAEQDVFQGLASAKRAKEKLISTEAAQFSGATGQLQSAYGVNRTAFGSSAAGTI